MNYKDRALSYINEVGYAVTSRQTFEGEANSLLIARAAKHEGSWVVWDPHDDEDGFLLVGDDKNSLIHDAWSHLTN